MGKFIIKILAFIMPIIALGVFEASIPLCAFTFRPDEALLYKHSGIGMPFYPNHKLQMNSVGDLCAYTNYSIKKDELWIIDKLGYRNDQFIEDPDVVIIGDSFTLGSSLSQDSILTNLLMLKFNYKLKFYGLATYGGSAVADFKVLLDKKVIKKPKLVIFELGEREIPSQYNLNTRGKLFKSSKANIWVNKASRFYSINFIKSRISNKRIVGIQSEINKKMFFLNGNKQWKYLDKIDSIADIIETNKNFCDSLGISFLFLPCPNKETVYYDEVPFIEQPKYLFELAKELKERNITTINSLELFNLFRQNNNSLVYHLDDTHWNSKGVNIVVDEIVREISIKYKLEQIK